jgi:hypothetical protein
LARQILPRHAGASVEDLFCLILSQKVRILISAPIDFPYL